MKTTLRIFRIISKLLLLAYVTIVNFVFITVFYALLLSILRHIWPAYIPGLFDEGVIPYLVNTLPYYLLLLFILYSISPLNVWVLRRKEGYRPMNSSDRMRVERLLSEMGMNRKLKLYRNNDARVNAAAFGFNTIGLTGGVLASASDEELKGIISHEVGHIGKSSVRCPLKPKRFYPLKIFNNAPSKSLDRWGYYYFSLFPSVCRHLPDTFSV